MKKTFSRLLFFAVLCMGQGAAWSSEADLKIPDLHQGSFNLFGGLTGFQILLYGAMVILGTMGLSLYQFVKVKAFPAHKSMLDVAETIFQTCKTYLKQLAKFLTILFAIIACPMAYYFIALKHESITTLGLVLLFSVVGMAGSVLVAFYGIRINTYANARTAFASLRGIPWEVVNIPMRAGMSVGLFLISIELVMMVSILLFVPRDIVGYCFLGFAIGESLGASALRIAGGIFTKIADIGSDLMKIVFQVKEDDPRNPGVIADCAGDNAGDSVGPTADGFETYGVTGVALISFILLAVKDPVFQVQLLVWIFSMRLVMIIASGLSYWINGIFAKARYGNAAEMNFETPLTSLVFITSFISIGLTYLSSYLLIPDLGGGTLWWKLASIITCGTAAGAIIPELVKRFTSTESAYVENIYHSSKVGGPSLNILAGLTAGNFSAYWMGFAIMVLMGVAAWISTFGLSELMISHRKRTPLNST